MKATISKFGVLTISPESELEEFALFKWYKDWCNGKSTFMVEVGDAATSSIVVNKYVHTLKED